MLDAWMALSYLDGKGVGPATARRLLAAFGRPEAILARTAAELIEAGASPSAAEALAGFREWNKVKEARAALDAAGARALTWDDDAFPEILRELPDGPVILYTQGEYAEADRLAVALVGTRKPTDYGLRVAKGLARRIAEAGITVVSGLALGIDAAAHEGALAAEGGRTLAVLGSGIDNLSPRSNAPLARRVAERGAVFSEFFPGSEGRPEHFPRRNRIVSALSLGVVVVEAGEKSGTLHTVRHANDQGRTVFAVPGPIDAPASAGPNRLIRDGAVIVTEVMDIIEQIVPDYQRRERLEPPAALTEENFRRRFDLTGDAALVVEALSRQPCHVDEIAESTKLPAQRLMTLLLELELRGIASAKPGKYYVLNLEAS